jgi:hypothetical protein
MAIPRSPGMVPVYETLGTCKTPCPCRRRFEALASIEKRPSPNLYPSQSPSYAQNGCSRSPRPVRRTPTKDSEKIPLINCERAWLDLVKNGQFGNSGSYDHALGMKNTVKGPGRRGHYKRMGPRAKMLSIQALTSRILRTGIVRRMIRNGGE